MHTLKETFFQFLFLLIILSLCSFVTPFSLPRLGTLRRSIHHLSKTIPSSLVSDYRKSYFTQKLDHFNYRPESYTTFKQKYVINAKYWGGAISSAPIFAYFGEEQPLDYGGIGFLTDNAPRFEALLVYIEHRYYGESVPFGLSTAEALKNSSIRGHFNSAQALADYAAVLLHVKKTYCAETCPIIVVGASYGGMLASWFRLKYPHIAHGALASSAPILYFDDIIPPEKGYFSIVTKDFKDISESCYETIRNSWGKIDTVASKPNGLSILSKRFGTCEKLKRVSDLKDYLDRIYAGAAQYNEPPFQVDIICKAIDAAPIKTDILDKIIAGVKPFKGRSCHQINVTELFEGWAWQRCSEMVMPISHGNGPDSMFPPELFDFEGFANECHKMYGVEPQPHWITTNYGGHDLKSILHRFGSNIIFSNGLRDPTVAAGKEKLNNLLFFGKNILPYNVQMNMHDTLICLVKVLEDVSESVVAISTVNGSHCLDMDGEEPSDPQWLIDQRKTEVRIIEGWIAKYHSDRQSIKEHSPAS